MKSQLLAFLIFIFCFSNCTKLNKTYYHEYEETASDYRIVKWNLSVDSLPRYYIKETTDKFGRVIELKYFENKVLKTDNLCFLSTWIKYQYPNDSVIIELNLGIDGNQESSIECGKPSKTIYYLTNDKRKILKTETEYKIDTALYLAGGFTKELIKEVVKEIKKGEKTSWLIDGYSESISKLNGIFPVSKEFDTTLLNYNKLEMTEIIKVLKRKK